MCGKLKIAALVVAGHSATTNIIALLLRSNDNNESSHVCGVMKNEWWMRGMAIGRWLAAFKEK